ncbi:hypothetical protein G7K71_02770 [Desulfofundulus sp. TPOSR]|uniref:hypothetical protein n=1 Tax=Desulfofundulus sp. TPOSR TaxID=2714340 RepID=UPI00140B965C|nr:hypothetical protein [Desulfofundulus sp. TPOSR]NHM25949.1 hypothetical protein [Desulfofundulus sp. TPOSR]
MWDKVIKHAGNHPICQVCQAAELHREVDLEGSSSTLCSTCAFGQNDLKTGFSRSDLEKMVHDVKEAAAVYRSITDQVEALLGKWKHALYCSPLYNTRLGREMWQLYTYPGWAGDQIIKILSLLLEHADPAASPEIMYWVRREK